MNENTDFNFTEDPEVQTVDPQFKLNRQLYLQQRITRKN